VRKVSGFRKPSKANEVTFLTAVEEIAAASRNLLNSLETKAPPKKRAKEVIIEPASLDVKDFKGVLSSPKKKPVSIEEMKAAVRKRVSSGTRRK